MKKNMYVLLLTMLLGIGGTFHLSAQKRVDRQPISFQEKSENITKVLEWFYDNSTGRWRSEKNILSMQVKTVLFNSRKYYVLRIEQWYGGYLYPNLKEDWVSYKKTIGFIYNADEFDKLHKFESDSTIENCVGISMGEVEITAADKTNGEKIEDKILAELISQDTTNKSASDKAWIIKHVFNFEIMKSKESTIRFLLPVENEKKPEEYTWDNEGHAIEHIDHNREFHLAHFDAHYFEINREIFSSLFKLTKN